MTFFPELQEDNSSELPDRAQWSTLSGLVEIRLGDCHEQLDTIDSETTALVLFSPPYDKLREYGNEEYSFNLHKLGGQIERILRPGGICVMVIQDQIIEGGRSLTSIRTTLDWCDSFGLKLFEMLVYARHGAPGAQSHYRFRVDHEYMPVFLKGDKPAYFSPEHLATRSATPEGRVMSSGAGRRHADGVVRYSKKKVVSSGMISRGTIWRYSVGIDRAAQEDGLKFLHPATYPDKLAWDHVNCWAEPGALVVDPFVGSGSTAVACMVSGRRCIGIDRNEDYVSLARQRCASLATWSEKKARRPLE